MSTPAQMALRLKHRGLVDAFPEGICYVVTHIDRHGMRTLTFANQGRNHRRTAEEAQHHLDEILKHTSEETLRQCYGPKAIGTFEVRPVECYSHGDAKRVYFDTFRDGGAAI